MPCRALLTLLLALPALAAAQADREGCKDHPAVTRMPGFFIENCQAKEFESVQLYTKPSGGQSAVEGRFTELNYGLGEGKSPPGSAAVVRNYENAVVKAGGKVVVALDDGAGRVTTLQLKKDGKELWIQVSAYNPSQYNLQVVEKEAMVQAVVADAAALKAGLAAAGHVEVPGILFDTGKSTLKPESDKALGELAKLLAASPGLKVYVVGHTDNAGALAGNLALSSARADAVVKALVGRFQVDAKRLSPFGAGPYAPVASNATEEGKARNRRVELVAQ